MTRALPVKKAIEAFNEQSNAKVVLMTDDVVLVESTDGCEEHSVQWVQHEVYRRRLAGA